MSFASPAEEIAFLKVVRDRQAEMIRKLQREVDCARSERDRAVSQGDTPKTTELRRQVADLQTQLAKAEANADRWHMEAMKRKDATV